MSSLLKSPPLSFSFSSSLSTTKHLSLLPLSLPRSRPAPRIQAKIREIFMPALSSTMTEGKIVSWVKSEGDVLTKGEAVVVVESDKADMDVETFYDGILAAIVVNDGETAPVGAPIGLLAETEADVAEAKAKAKAGGGVKTEVANDVPPMTKNDAPAAMAAASSAVAPTGTPKGGSGGGGGGKVVVTPYAKKLAKQHKVDVNNVVGTGPFGRVTPEDVEKAAGVVKKVAASAAAAAKGGEEFCTGDCGGECGSFYDNAVCCLQEYDGESLGAYFPGWVSD